MALLASGWGGGVRYGLRACICHLKDIVGSGKLWQFLSRWSLSFFFSLLLLNVQRSTVVQKAQASASDILEDILSSVPSSSIYQLCHVPQAMFALLPQSRLLKGQIPSAWISCCDGARGVTHAAALRGGWAAVSGQYMFLAITCLFLMVWRHSGQQCQRIL